MPRRYSKDVDVGPARGPRTGCYHRAMRQGHVWLCPIGAPISGNAMVAWGKDVAINLHFSLTAKLEAERLRRESRPRKRDELLCKIYSSISTTAAPRSLLGATSTPLLVAERSRGLCCSCTAAEICHHPPPELSRSSVAPPARVSYNTPRAQLLPDEGSVAGQVAHPTVAMPTLLRLWVANIMNMCAAIIRAFTGR